MGRRIILWVVAAALLLPTLCKTNEYADDDLHVTEVEDGEPARGQPRSKVPKHAKRATPTKHGAKPHAGVHVTYKNAAGEDKDLDEDLRRACGRADLQEIRKLLDLRKEITDLEDADIHSRDKYGNGLLHDAARQGLLDVARLLLEDGGHDVNLENGMADRPLHMSAAAGHVIYRLSLSVSVCLSVSLSPSLPPSPSLSLSAASGQLPMTELLVKHGAEIDPQTSWGMTPMYWTAHGGSEAHIEVARFLLSRGAGAAASLSLSLSLFLSLSLSLSFSLSL